MRRIDALEGRPRWEEEYLALGGRVFIRRDLLWIGFAAAGTAETASAGAFSRRVISIPATTSASIAMVTAM